MLLDDGHEDLFGGVWPFIKRVLFVFLPIWVAMIVWYAGVDYMIIISCYFLRLYQLA